VRLRNSVGGVWCETFAAAGDLDYARIQAILDRHAFAGPLLVEIVREEATPRTQPLAESHRQSLVNLRALFGV